MAVFHSTPPARPGSTKGFASVWRVGAVPVACALPYQLLVALKSARRLAISAARCSAKRCLSSGVTLVSPLGPWLSHEGLTKFEGGLGHELVPPGAVLRLRQGSRFGEGRREVEVGQVALKRPAVGHF